MGDKNMNLPENFVKKMKNLLKEDYETYAASLEKERVYGLRSNSLKIDEEFLKKKGIWKLQQIPWCKEGYYYDGKERPSKHPYYYAGLYYLQEPSAMTPGAMLPIEKGDKVLDICAAPGGKSTQLGAKLLQSGFLVSNDISATRTKALLKNIELFGIRNAIVTNEPPQKLESRFEQYFDKIIIDAPCSGEGMFRKEPDVIKSWGEKMSDFCQTQQKAILESSAKMLQPGGMLLYSTCTFAPEENEQSIQDFLNSHEDFELLPLPKIEGFENGHPEWIENGQKELCYCKRLFPHKVEGEGHFLALLQKKGEKREIISAYEQETKEERLSYFFEFQENFLNLEMKGIFKVFGDNLYLLPSKTPLLNGIRIVRSGWFLGTFKKKRFEPSQAFAMGLKKENAKIVIDFDLENKDVIRYLKGESLEMEKEGQGWCLVCVDGFPLGWGKLQNGRLKNKYFAGWKWE